VAPAYVAFDLMVILDYTSGNVTILMDANNKEDSYP
jgi:hypothetical protein